MTKISGVIEKPLSVTLLCIVFLLMGSVFDGTLWRLYALRENNKQILSKLKEENDKIDKIEHQLRQLKNPAYIEKQARDRLEFLEKEDLLFVFSED